MQQNELRLKEKYKKSYQNLEKVKISFNQRELENIL